MNRKTSFFTLICFGLSVHIISPQVNNINHQPTQKQMGLLHQMPFNKNKQRLPNMAQQHVKLLAIASGSIGLLTLSTYIYHQVQKPKNGSGQLNQNHTSTDNQKEPEPKKEALYLQKIQTVTTINETLQELATEEDTQLIYRVLQSNNIVDNLEGLQTLTEYLKLLQKLPPDLQKNILLHARWPGGETTLCGILGKNLYNLDAITPFMQHCSSALIADIFIQPTQEHVKNNFFIWAFKKTAYKPLNKDFPETYSRFLFNLLNLLPKDIQKQVLSPSLITCIWFDAPWLIEEVFATLKASGLSAKEVKERKKNTQKKINKLFIDKIKNFNQSRTGQIVAQENLEHLQQNFSLAAQKLKKNQLKQACQKVQEIIIKTIHQRNQYLHTVDLPNPVTNI